MENQNQEPEAVTELPVMTLEEALAALNRAEAAQRETEDTWLRARAEMENVRRRNTAEVTQARKFALESFASELLSVMDSLDAALGVQEATVESFRNGVELTARQLASVFEKFNISAIEPVGDRFDPNRHQAIASLPHDSLPAQQVIAVMQKGFALHERVLRPALVTVSSGPQTASPS